MPITGLPDEQRIREFFDRGEKEEGKKLLLELIGTIARQKKFTQAEQLRDWLMEEDSLALNDIIKAAEIIEEEKAAAVDKDYLNVWAPLAAILDSDDFATLYHSLEHRKFTSGEMIVRQGAKQSALYFVNSGRVELFYQDNGREHSVKTLGAGEILGSAGFFEASVWTLSARSLGADLSLLEMDRLQALKDDHPALESSLNDFCLKYRIPYEFIKKIGRDRRAMERHRLSGRIAMALLDREGKDTGIGARGELFDISAGGVSFYLRISQKKNARLLLGRTVRLSLPLAKDQIFSVSGTVLAVRSQPVVGNEYSVHVRFAEILDQEELKKLINAGK